MAKLRQIQVRYLPEHDRILIRMSGGEAEEYRMWVTRRYLRVLWSMLARFVAAEPVVVQQVRPESRRAVLDFQREKALAEADFKTRFREPPPDRAALPLGEEPLLLERVELRRNADGRDLLWLGDRTRRGVEVMPTRQIVHSLAKLLADANRRAEWGLSLELSSAPPSETIQVARPH
jgi:hypothetical protein